MKTIILYVIAIFLAVNLMACSNNTANTTSYKNGEELVVLAHGLGRSDWSMWRLAQRLEAASYNVCRLDYATIGESVEAVLAETSQQIDVCIQKAPKVHFVGHSLGGLVIRAYLQQHNDKLVKTRLGEVVLMGTPNKGSELADHLSDSWIMAIGGDISRALMTGNNSLGQRLDDELADNVKSFDVNIGVIAGTKPSSLTADKFTGPNDGLVSVESTKLTNMTDFIEVDVNHTQMRNSEEVAEQTIFFLKKRTFKHK